MKIHLFLLWKPKQIVFLFFHFSRMTISQVVVAFPEFDSCWFIKHLLGNFNRVLPHSIPGSEHLFGGTLVPTSWRESFKANGGLIASQPLEIANVLSNRKYTIESENIPGFWGQIPWPKVLLKHFFIPPVLSNRASSLFFFFEISSFQTLETPHRDAVCCATTQKTLSYEGPSGPKVAKVDLLGGGLKRLLFSPQTLGKCSKLTSIFFRWVWGSQP